MSMKIKPVSRVERIETEINRIVCEVFSQSHKTIGLDESWVPWIDISEKENEIIVEIELPGIAQKDITVLLSSNRIEIKGIKRGSRSRKKIRYLRLEREYGAFRRYIFLPNAVIPEKTNALLENGVLTLTLKKYKASRKKEVVVEIRKTKL